MARYLETILKKTKPIGWGQNWPVNNIVIHRDRKNLDVLIELHRSGWKIICCLPTNREVLELQHQFTREHPTLKTFRSVSKGQNLVEVMNSLGVPGFKVTYYPSSCQYSLGVINEPQTITDIRNALNAQGLDGKLARKVFETAYTLWSQIAPDAAKNDFWFFTNAAFNARLTGFRTVWWEKLGFVREYMPFGKYDQELKSNGMLARGIPKVLVVYVEPPLKEFDEFRPVTDVQAAELGASRGKYAKWRFKRQDAEYWEDEDFPNMPSYDFHVDCRPVKTSESLALRERGKHMAILRRPLHAIGKENGEPVEYRHPGMELGTGVGRGFSSRSERPKVVVLTSSSNVFREACRSLFARGQTASFQIQTGPSIARLVRQLEGQRKKRTIRY